MDINRAAPSGVAGRSVTMLTMDPPVVQPPPLAGLLLRLVRTGAACTRADLVRISGLSRPTVAGRVNALIGAGYLITTTQEPTRGRPPEALAFNAGGGVLLAADVGGTHTRVALTDLAANALAEYEADMDVAVGPDAVLGWVRDTFDQLLARVGRSREDVRGIGVGVPGPVEHTTGRVVSPPIMPGWDRVSVPEQLAAFDVPVIVDRDVNIIALGEHRSAWGDVDHVVVVKVGLGIGMALITSGDIYRGALGAAGELGHWPRGGDIRCRCGNRGCLEAVAGGWAILERLRNSGREVRTSRDIVNLVRAGDPEAVPMVRDAGHVLGEALADVVALLNPSTLIIAGNLAEVSEPLLAAIRESVYARAQPLATRDLLIAPSRLGWQAGTVGAAMLVQDYLFSPTRVSAELGL